MLLFSLLAIARADLPAGDPVTEALSAQISASGLEAMASVIPALVPTEPIAVDPISDSTGGFCLEYSYELSGLSVVVEVLGATITPSPGVLTVDADLLVTINDPADPFTLLLDAICLIDEDCSGWIDPFLVTASLPISLNVEGPPGGQTLVATVGTVGLVHELTLEKLQTDCAINDIESVLNFFGLSLFDLVISLFEDTLVSTIETTLNEALAAASYDDTLELAGAFVDVKLEPNAVSITDVGAELLFAAQLGAEPHECIAAFDPGVSVSTGGPRPSPADNPSGAQLAIHVADDLVNQALYAFWRSGLLCQQLIGEEIDIGLPVDTTLLGLIGGAPYQELFPDPKPMDVVTIPHVAPVVQPDGPNDLDLELRQLDLLFFAELDGRAARVLGVAIDADVGAMLVFDETTGALAVELDVSDEGVIPTMVGDVMVPGSEDEVLANFGSVVTGLLGTVLGGLLGDSLTFTLPTVGELGLTSASVDASGAEGDWLAVYGTLGTVDYYDPYATGCGCGETTTTGTGGCGCSTSGGAAFGWVFAAALILLRRR